MKRRQKEFVMVRGMPFSPRGMPCSHRKRKAKGIVQFLVYPHPETMPFHYTVAVYRTFKELRKAHGHSKECLAFFSPDGEEKRSVTVDEGKVWDFTNTHIGEIALCRAEKELVLSVVHESFHATLWAQQKLGFETSTERVSWADAWAYTKAETHEELAARWHESLVGKILQELKRRKILKG